MQIIGKNRLLRSYFVTLLILLFLSSIFHPSILSSEETNHEIEDEILVWICSDIHVAGINHEGTTSVGMWSYCIKDALSLSPEYAFANGDLIMWAKNPGGHTYDEQWHNFWYNPSAEYGWSRLYDLINYTDETVGNHDANWGNQAQGVTLNWTYQLGNLLFISLGDEYTPCCDYITPEGYAGRYINQLEWLRTEVIENVDKNIIVLCHYPIRGTTKKALETTLYMHPSCDQQYVDFFEWLEHSEYHIDCWIYGHTHNNPYGFECIVEKYNTLFVSDLAISQGGKTGSYDSIFLSLENRSDDLIVMARRHNLNSYVFTPEFPYSYKLTYPIDFYYNPNETSDNTSEAPVDNNDGDEVIENPVEDTDNTTINDDLNNQTENTTINDVDKETITNQQDNNYFNINTIALILIISFLIVFVLYWIITGDKKRVRNTKMVMVLILLITVSIGIFVFSIEKEEIQKIEIGDCVDINYIGRYASNDTIFASSYEDIENKTGGEYLRIFLESTVYDFPPIGFAEYTSEIVQGLKEGLIGLKEGETVFIDISPEKGFGSKRISIGDAFDTKSITNSNLGYELNQKVEVINFSADEWMTLKWVDLENFGKFTMPKGVIIDDLASSEYTIYDILPPYSLWENSSEITDSSDETVIITTTPTKTHNITEDIRFIKIGAKMGVVFSDSTTASWNETEIILESSPVIGDFYNVDYFGNDLNVTINDSTDSYINITIEFEEGIQNLTVARSISFNRSYIMNRTYQIPFKCFGLFEQDILDAGFSLNKLAGEYLIYEVIIEKIYKSN